MALADKIKNMIYERTGKEVRLSEYLVTEFRKRVGGEKEKLAAFRTYLDNNTDSEYPLHGFLDSDIPLTEFKTAVTGGRIVDEKTLLLASKVYGICDLALSGKSLVAASSLLETYEEKEILDAFRHFYAGLDTFYQKNAVKDFFERGAAEPIIISIRDQKAKQERVLALAKAPENAKPLYEPIEPQESDEGGTGLLD